MASPLARRVARAIRQGLWHDPDRVIVAVSAGADSVGLTWLLAELQARARWTLAGLVHAGGLAPSLHAADVVDAFWGEPSSRTGPLSTRVGRCPPLRRVAYEFVFMHINPTRMRKFCLDFHCRLEQT